jgi:hypothetical protein
MTEHTIITDPYLHEPKGVASAAANKVYVSNGAGSGSWLSPYVMGWEDVADSGVTQNLTSGAWVDLTNDGNGLQTTSTYLIPGTTSAWDPIANEFNWADAGLGVGDTVDIRFDYDVTVNTNNDQVKLALDMAHGHANEFQLLIDARNIDTAGTVNVVRFVSIYMGSTEVVNNPTKVVMFADSAADSVVLNGFFVRYLPRLTVYA